MIHFALILFLVDYLVTVLTSRILDVNGNAKVHLSPGVGGADMSWLNMSSWRNSSQASPHEARHYRNDLADGKATPTNALHQSRGGCNTVSEREFANNWFNDHTHKAWMTSAIQTLMTNAGVTHAIQTSKQNEGLKDAIEKLAKCRVRSYEENESLFKAQLLSAKLNDRNWFKEFAEIIPKLDDLCGTKIECSDDTSLVLNTAKMWKRDQKQSDLEADFATHWSQLQQGPDWISDWLRIKNLCAKDKLDEGLVQLWCNSAKSFLDSYLSRCRSPCRRLLSDCLKKPTSSATFSCIHQSSVQCPLGHWR